MCYPGIYTNWNRGGARNTEEENLMLVVLGFFFIIFIASVGIHDAEQRVIVANNKLLLPQVVDMLSKNNFSKDLRDDIVRLLLGTEILIDEVEPLLQHAWFINITDFSELSQRINAVKFICKALCCGNNANKRHVYCSINRRACLKV